MTNQNSTTPSKGPDIASYTALAAALGAALGAWKLFEPKLERMRAMRNEVGSPEIGFRIFYQIPQYVLIILSIGTVLFLLLAFVDSLRPGALSTYSPLVSGLLAPENIIWVVVSLGAVGAIIYWNLIPRLLMCLAWLVSAVPIPWLQNRFGPSGESLGWHQAAAVMEGPDKGQPLMIDNDAIERVAWGVLARLSQKTASTDYAAKPENLSQSESANIALFGCIMEANFYAQRWSSPSWAAFYAILADIQRTDGMFAPKQLLGFQSGQAFFETFRDRLESALKARNQPCPPDRALAAAADISVAWERLKAKARGDTLQLIPWYSPWLGGQVAGLDKRLRRFPRLNDEGMRPQLIKLLVRWNALPMSSGVFAQPFAKRQAWLLLQQGALRALPEMKEITFHSTGQAPIARIAALRVIWRVVALIEGGASAEALSAASMLGSSRWTRLEIADIVFWSWASADAKKATSENWNTATWRWKLDDDRIQRLR